MSERKSRKQKRLRRDAAARRSQRAQSLVDHVGQTMQVCFFPCRDDAVGLPANTELDRTFGHARRTLAPRRRDGNARTAGFALAAPAPWQELEGRDTRRFSTVSQQPCKR